MESKPTNTENHRQIEEFLCNESMKSDLSRVLTSYIPSTLLAL
jgi:hypothetical protein